MCYKNKKIYDKLMINISFNRDRSLILKCQTLKSAGIPFTIFFFTFISFHNAYFLHFDYSERTCCYATKHRWDFKTISFLLRQWQPCCQGNLPMQTIFPRNELSLNLIFFKMRSFGNITEILHPRVLIFLL